MTPQSTATVIPSSAHTIRPRMYSGDDPVSRYLNGIHTSIIESYSVEHPFLNWYANNRLTPDQEKILFSECYYWFRNIPFYIATMAQLTRDPRILKEITLNVADEVCGEQTHAELYLKFLSTIGISKDQVRAYDPSDETRAVNGTMELLYKRTPIEKALGAMYYDETMSGIMVSKINNGLSHAGYGSETRFFWEMHIEVEKGHSNSVFNAIYPYLQEDCAREAFEDGIKELSRLVELFWDKVTVLLDLRDILPSRSWSPIG